MQENSTTITQEKGKTKSNHQHQTSPIINSSICPVSGSPKPRLFVRCVHNFHIINYAQKRCRSCSLIKDDR